VQRRGHDLAHGFRILHGEVLNCAFELQSH
jgi:hypothetical protein